jgi:hypothetical protein
LNPTCMPMTVTSPRRLALGVALVSSLYLPNAACRRNEPPPPPVATPSVTLNRDKAPLGGPIEMTFKFAVAPDARFTEDFRVMVHVVDTDEQMIFALDHNPPVPTSQWKPGQTVEYTRTEFVPVYPYVGDASVQVGLYSLTTQQRLPLGGDEVGQRAYRVARFQLQPQTDSVYTVFKEGWHPAESAEQNSRVEWQWTKKTATMAFKNPKRDSTFYLDVDNPGGIFEETQEVQVSIGGQVVGRFTVTPKQQALHKIPLKADQMGAADMVDLQIDVDKSFVPAQVASSGSKDPRELGIRVFHAVVQPNN